MASFNSLLSQLGDPARRGEAHGRLLKASERVVPHLCEAVRSHPESAAREICAEILGDRKMARAIPSLIEALDDESFFVRPDALWAIENLAQYQTGGLQDWLLTDCEKPKELKRKVRRWWRLNRRYVEDNFMFW